MTRRLLNPIHNKTRDIKQLAVILQLAGKHFPASHPHGHPWFDSGLASACVYRAMDRLAPGMTEMEVAGHMCSLGQPVSVTTICAAGERFGGAVVFPRNKKIRVGHKFSLTMGLRGGLSSRAAYVAAGEEDMEDAVKDYVEVLAKPY